jgi:hypothetical protein
MNVFQAITLQDTLQSETVYDQHPSFSTRDIPLDQDLSTTFVISFEELLNIDPTHSFLHVNLEAAIQYQVKEWSSLLDRMVFDYVFIDHSLKDHLNALYYIFLMQSGHFADHLLKYLKDLDETAHIGELNLMLRELVWAHLVELSSEYYERISFIPVNDSVLPIHQRHHPLIHHVFNMVHLSYKIDWPLNVIFTPSTMQTYYSLFAHMSLFRHTSLLLRSMFMKASFSSSSTPHYNTSFHLGLFQMRHFVHAMLEYLNDVAIHTNWLDFIKQLHSKPMHLDELRHCHQRHLDQIYFLSLLHRRDEALLQKTYSILQLIHRFVETKEDFNQSLAIFQAFQLQMRVFLHTLSTLEPSHGLQNLVVLIDMNGYYDYPRSV